MDKIDVILNQLLLESDPKNAYQIKEIRKSFEKISVEYIPRIDCENFNIIWTDILTTIFDKLSIPEVNEDGEFIFPPEIISIKDYYMEHLQILSDLNNFLILYRSLYNIQYNDKFLENIVVKCIIIYTQFSNEEIYTDSKTVVLARNGIQTLVSLSNCASIDELMFGTFNGNQLKTDKDIQHSNAVVCRIIQKVFRKLFNLCKKNSKKRRSYIPSFFWFLHNTKGEHMEEFGAHLVNFFLLLLDDIEENHKSQALVALDEIIDRLINKEFNLYYRNLVIYNALIQQVDGCMVPGLIKQIYVCLIKWAKFLDDAKVEDIFCDEVLDKILSRMISETKLNVRRVYIDSLHLAITTFGIPSVSFWSCIKSVITQYLDVDDGQEAETRLATLDVAIASMKFYWPVLDDCDIAEINHAVLLFLLAISINKTINEEAKSLSVEKSKIIFDLSNPKERMKLKSRLANLSDKCQYFNQLLEYL